MLLEDVITKIECDESSENYGRFVVEPLDPGFGVTLGNSLRRVLLSSLLGAAVTAVKIEGVQHEFTTIPHVKEDVIEFLLNVKELRLKAFSEQSGRLFLEVKGEGIVCAGDIKPSADFEVVNPELHLATLDSPDAFLDVVLYVEQGKGYVPAGRGDGLPLGVIPVDATPPSFLCRDHAVLTASQPQAAIIRVGSRFTIGFSNPVIKQIHGPSSLFI